MSQGPAVLQACGVECGYNGRKVLAGMDLSLHRGEFLAVLGPNGSGKTTLLRALAGVLPLMSGQVLLEGRPISAMPRQQVARTMAVVPQLSTPPFEFTVREMVAMGRSPHLGRLQAERPEDREAVAEALSLTGTSHLAARPVTELSGGELQRVTIARALAQQAPIMLLDEPGAFLDLNHQLHIFNLLVELNVNQSRSILCISHDVNLASEYAQRLVLMQQGRVVCHGAPEQVLTADNILQVYGCRVEVDHSPSGRPRITLLPGAQAGAAK